MLRVDDFQKSQLVLIAYKYSLMYGQGGHLLAEIIMSCIMNRVKRGWGTLLEVIDRIPMYTAENEVPTGTPLVWEPTFLKLLHSVEGIFDGTLDTAKGGLYWADLRKVETDFFINKILANPEEHPRIVDMNSFAVFR
jgi:hypothetical protein